MGRWRDACVLMRNKSDLIDPDRLEELVIDQRSEIVGSDGDGAYRVTKYEQDRPRLVKFKILYDKLDDFNKAERRGWVNKDTGKRVNDFVKLTPEIYSEFQRNVARVFSFFPFGFDFLAYLRGPASYKDYSDGLELIVPVTPIHITEKDYHYKPEGVVFPGCVY